MVLVVAREKWELNTKLDEVVEVVARVADIAWVASKFGPIAWVMGFFVAAA